MPWKDKGIERVSGGGQGTLVLESTAPGPLRVGRGTERDSKRGLCSPHQPPFLPQGPRGAGLAQ